MQRKDSILQRVIFGVKVQFICDRIVLYDNFEHRLFVTTRAAQQSVAKVKLRPENHFD